jgi:hypothetical protein
VLSSGMRASDVEMEAALDVLHKQGKRAVPHLALVASADCLGRGGRVTWKALKCLLLLKGSGKKSADGAPLGAHATAIVGAVDLVAAVPSRHKHCAESALRKAIHACGASVAPHLDALLHKAWPVLTSEGEIDWDNKEHPPYAHEISEVARRALKECGAHAGSLMPEVIRRLVPDARAEIGAIDASGWPEGSGGSAEMRAAALELATGALRAHARPHADTIQTAIAGAAHHGQVVLRRAAAMATFTLLLHANKGVKTYDADGSMVERLKRLCEDEDDIVRETAQDCWGMLDDESGGSSLDPDDPDDDAMLAACVAGWRDDDEFGRELRAAQRKGWMPPDPCMCRDPLPAGGIAKWVDYPDGSTEEIVRCEICSKLMPNQSDHSWAKRLAKAKAR